MYELKPLSTGAIPAALARAERYRLLNEPEQAESICLDVLAVDPENRVALTMLLLALTDQFADGNHPSAIGDAMKLVERFPQEYERAYYRGLISERRGRALLSRGGPGSGFVAADWLHDAMHWFEQADAMRPAENDDARLRWNACVRVIERRSLNVVPSEERNMPAMLE